jgi:hypothetical protein
VDVGEQGVGEVMIWRRSSRGACGVDFHYTLLPAAASVTFRSLAIEMVVLVSVALCGVLNHYALLPWTASRTIRPFAIEMVVCVSRALCGIPDSKCSYHEMYLVHSKSLPLRWPSPSQPLSAVGPIQSASTISCIRYSQKACY